MHPSPHNGYWQPATRLPMISPIRQPKGPDQLVLPGTSVRSPFGTDVSFSPQPFLYLSYRRRQKQAAHGSLKTILLQWYSFSDSEGFLKSPMQAPDDTTICYLDTISLHQTMVIQASSVGRPITGSVHWPLQRHWSTRKRIPLTMFPPITRLCGFPTVCPGLRDSVKIRFNNTDTPICSFDTVHLYPHMMER